MSVGRGGASAGVGMSSRQKEVLLGTWKKEESNALSFNFAGPPPGPVEPVTSDTTIVDVFYRYFTPEVWELLVVETNHYGAGCREVQAPTRAGRRRPWQDVTVEEMKAYVGMSILMGIVVLPRIQMYWSKEWDLLVQPLANVMSKTRFEQISRFLHVCNTTEQVRYGQPGHDPLFKIRKLLDLVTPNLQSVYNPHEEISVDEAMIPFKGRLGFKQYMKAKPTKWE